MSHVTMHRELDVLRPMSLTDLKDVMDAQELGAVKGLAEVFPQDEYPFPRERVAAGWRREVADPGIACYVVIADDKVAGFAATQDAELLHFGTATEFWGSGLAATAHAALLKKLRHEGHERADLYVFAENRRGRRFYEKLGWRATGGRRGSAFPPHPELLHYELATRPAGP